MADNMVVHPGKVRVRRWGFCPRCKGQGCSDCDGKGKIAEVVSLANIPRLLRNSYAAAQQEFLREQLNTKSVVMIIDVKEEKPLVEISIREYN